MASQEEAAASIPRKRIATYGKAVRRRIPEQSFARFRQSQSPEKKTAPIPSSSPSVTPLESMRLKNSKKRHSPSAIPALKGNVFDVPSSDDESATPSAPMTSKPAPKAMIKAKVQRPLETRVAPSGEDVERRKRIKLSPVAMKVEQRVAPKKAAKTSSPPRKVLQNSIELGNVKVMATRPKISSVVNRKPERVRTPRRLSTSPIDYISYTPPVLHNDSETMDVDTPTGHLTPRGQQIWKAVLDTVDSDVTGGPPFKSTTTGHSKLLYQAAGVSKSSQRSPRKLPRRRLIDSLVEQATEEDVGEEESDPDNADTDILRVPDPHDTHIVSRSQSLVPELSIQTPVSSSQGSQTQNSGPKFTYAKQRSMLAEEDLMAQLALDMPTQPAPAPNGRKSRRGSIPKLVPLQSFHEEEEDNEASSQTIRSVHELRQAGANNRFMDEIEDLLDRIGKPSPKPSSSRRSALLEIASKFDDKNFVRQFRANGVEQRLFVHLGQETDLVTGFIMISILMALLVDTSMPHIIIQLRRQGITRLLIRLVESPTSIVALSKERRANMSKMAQSLIARHQKMLLRMPIWEDLQPQSISPRTTALKCLEVMVRQTREAGNSSDIISKELTTSLFDILKPVSNEESWNLPHGENAIDFYLALSALESHSITARTVNDEAIWISDYLPIIADNLEVALSRPAHSFGNMQTLVLRLTLNITNNNPKASEVFAKGSLMAVMGRVIVAKFRSILSPVIEEDFSLVVDHLVLILGLMINFADGSLPARESFESLQSSADDPLEAMVQLFVDNVAGMSEAESLEESQKNVAFGYLAVLLGYLSLSPVLAKRIAAQLPRGTLRTVVASIEEFIGHHKAADSQFQVDDDGYSANTGLTERLEGLVVRLRATKSAGL